MRAWRYHPRLHAQLDALTSPLFDVVSQRQREALYREPHNSIHLSVPTGTDPAAYAKSTLNEWKQTGVLIQDPVPGIYAYYQYFSLPGSSRTYCRKGFVCFIRLHEWNDRVILRHESTMPFSVKDRMQMLAATQLNVSPTHGLYTDPSFEIEKYLDESMQAPLCETEDYQGVRDVLSVIHDARVIRRITSLISTQQIILADGHHRYEGSLQYMQHQKASNPGHTGNEGYNFHLMYLTNAASDDLRVLPTHRLVKDFPGFSAKWLLSKLEEDFLIKPVDEAPDVQEVILGKPWAFGLLVGDSAFKIRLKSEKITEITWNFPDQIRQLDLTVMHFFVFQKILGISGRDQVRSPYISFQRNFTECMKEVLTGEAQFALITQDISMDTIREVCQSGYTLPQKSTYFYPKVISGFLFGSIDENEWHSPFDTCFREPTQAGTDASGWFPV